LSLGVPLFLTADFLLYVFISTPNGHKNGILFAVVLFLAFSIGVISDVSYIAFMRWLLRRISSADHIGKILLATATQFLALAMIIVFPFYLGTKVAAFSEPVGFGLILSFAVNSIDVLAILLAISTAIAMLIHRLIWPALQRPLYAIQSLPLLKRKAVMWTFGTGLLAYSYAGVPRWIAEILSKVTH